MTISTGRNIFEKRQYDDISYRAVVNTLADEETENDPL